MIKILSNTKQTLHLLTRVKDYYTEAELEKAEKLLHFTFHKMESAFADIKPENYILTATDRYTIKEVNAVDKDYYEVFAKLDTDALKATLKRSFITEEQTIGEVLTTALSGTGWAYELHDLPTKRRTMREEDATPYEIILKAMELYGFECWFNTLTNSVHVYQTLGGNRGAYVYTDLNLSKFELQADTYDFRTRLYAYGKDGLTFASINGGKEYIDNNTYSSKTIEMVWKDERYTVAENLLADATAKLERLAKPRKTYALEVIALTKLNPIYNILDFQLGDTVSIIDKDNSLRDTQRIMKLTEYPYTPERNKIELANSKLVLQTSDAQQIRDIVNNEVVVIRTELMEEVERATNLITGELGGNLVIRTNASGKPYELLIMDTEDIATATNVWRWNQAGLGFSSSGYNGSYGTAITADGRINADFITAGTLSANLLKAGRIASADERFWLDLETGYFKLGGIRSDANGFVIGTEIEEAIADEVDKVGLYKVDIISSNGLVFKNGVVSTTLIARVYKNSIDVTDTINAARFKWTKTNADGTPDTAWNTSYAGGHKQVMITGEDIFQRASFKCEIMEV